MIVFYLLMKNLLWITIRIRFDSFHFKFLLFTLLEKTKDSPKSFIIFDFLWLPTCLKFPLLLLTKMIMISPLPGLFRQFQNWWGQFGVGLELLYYARPRPPNSKHGVIRNAKVAWCRVKPTRALTFMHWISKNEVGLKSRSKISPGHCACVVTTYDLIVQSHSPMFVAALLWRK